MSGRRKHARFVDEMLLLMRPRLYDAHEQEHVTVQNKHMYSYRVDARRLPAEGVRHNHSC